MNSTIRFLKAHQRISGFILMLVSLVSALVMVELAMRFVGRMPRLPDPGAANSARENKEIERWKQLLTRQGISDTTFNIYYFGESTMKGEPFIDTIPILVEKSLEPLGNSGGIRWVNLADWGIDLGESQRRINWVLDNTGVTRPSLLVLYSGHNEFLQYQNCCGFTLSEKYPAPLRWLISQSAAVTGIAKLLRMYRLEIDERSFFDSPAATNKQRERTIRLYQRQLREIAQKASEARVPIIISEVVSNYADFEPNRSVYCEDEGNRNRFKNLVQSGTDSVLQGRYSEAAASLSEAQAFCPSFAESHYWLGKALLGLENPVAAQKEFERAVDLDGMPIRAVTEENAYIRGLDGVGPVSVIDPKQVLLDSSPLSKIGYNYFSDGHHPNLLGYLYISRLMAEKMSSDFPGALRYRELGYAEAERLFLADNEAVKDMRLASVNWLIRMSTWRYDPSARLAKAKEYLDEITRQGKTGALSSMYYALYYFIQDNGAKAEEYLHIAMEKNPRETARLLSDEWIRLVIGRYAVRAKLKDAVKYDAMDK